MTLDARDAETMQARAPGCAVARARCYRSRLCSTVMTSVSRRTRYHSPTRMTLGVSVCRADCADGRKVAHLVSGTHLEIQCFWNALNSGSSVAASCACGRISPQNCANKRGFRDGLVI